MKKNFGKVFIFAITLGLLSSFIGCSKKSEAKKDYKTIGFIVDTLDNAYEVTMTDAFKAKCTADGNKAVIVSSDCDNQKAVNNIMNMITQKVDGIIIMATDTVSLTPALKDAQSAKIPVVTVCADVDKSAYAYRATFAGTDNVEQGVLGADALNTILGDAGGNIVEIQGTLGMMGQIDRDTGFNKEIVKYPTIHLLDEKAGDWGKSSAMSIMEDFIVKYPDLNAVFVQNNIMAEGAIEAINEANKTDDIKVVCTGLDKETKKLIKDGKIYGSADQDPVKEGNLSYDCILKAIQGIKMDKCTYVKMEFIDKNNVDNFNPAY